MKEKIKLLTVKMPKELYDSFKVAAKDNDLDMTKLVRGFVRGFVNDNKKQQVKK